MALFLSMEKGSFWGGNELSKVTRYCQFILLGEHFVSANAHDGGGLESPLGAHSLPVLFMYFCSESGSKEKMKVLGKCFPRHMEPLGPSNPDPHPCPYLRKMR
jgi:hypothetical protein